MFGLGVIEGFFGRDWGWSARSEQLPWLARAGFGSYVYAPKSDGHLRQAWRRPWPDPVRQSLGALRARAAAHGIRFGIGLTPFGIDPFRQADRDALAQRLREIATLTPDLLCLLFDDTPGGSADLARHHAVTARRVLAAGVARRVLVCPAYYSDDPVLAEVFGAPPPRYLETLAAGLPPEVGLFWTGPKVVSREIPRAHLASVALLMRRPAVLWDNAAVNDSRALSPFLPIGAYPARAQLRGYLAGLFVNPMNQPYLGRVALARVADAWHGRPVREDDAYFEDALGPELGGIVAAFQGDLAEVGLDGLEARRKAELRRELQSCAAHPAARELLDWLDGGYVFDPACLT